jgi:endonuclease YncB( thermonuclease family)
VTFGPYPATILAIHDGDTFLLDIDLGFGMHAETFRCRVYGINAPELATAAGKAALAYLETLMKTGDSITVLSHGWDKYGGRFDGEVTLADGRDLGTLMVSSGHAVVMK